MNLNELFKRIVIQMYGEGCAMNDGSCGIATAVHHIWPKGTGGCNLNTRYNPLNGIPLCEKCHRRIHDEVGEVVGRNEIIKAYPHLDSSNHKTIPLLGESEREIRKELMEVYNG